MKRILPLWFGLLAFAVVPALAQIPTVPMGKVHGQVINPTGAPQAAGTVSAVQTTRAASGPGLAAQTEQKGVFKVDQNGEFEGDLPAGSYTLIYREPSTPENQQVDHIDNVVVTAGQTTEQNIDMSRPAYIANLSPDERKQLDELRQHNSEAMKVNEVIKHLNADLKAVIQDFDEADKAQATAEQQLGTGATRQAIEAKSDEIKTAKYSDAEQLMTKDTGAKPDASILWAQLGQAQLGLKKYDDAAASFKKALDLETASKKPLVEVQGMAQSGLGAALAREGKTDDAEAAFDAAVKINPAKAEFYLKNETVIFFQKGDAAAQVASADKALAADPNPEDPNLAVIYYLKGQGLVGNATIDPKTNKIVLPPGCAEAYQKYLELAPNGPYSADAKGILAQAGQTISSSYKASKKK